MVATPNSQRFLLGERKMNLETHLKQRGIPFDLHKHPPALTAQELAHREHVSGYMVAKPVVVMGRSAPTMCVLQAPRKLDLRRIGDILGDPDVRLATETEMMDMFPDCELGAEPPVGSMFGMQTIMDSKLKEDDVLVMQAGTHTDAIRIRREDWELVCEPIVGTITAT